MMGNETEDGDTEMTTKPLTTVTFTATHENGTSWRLGVNAKIPNDKFLAQAKNFARNYCRKHRIHGAVELENETTGEVIKFVVGADYSVL